MSKKTSKPDRPPAPFTAAFARDFAKMPVAWQVATIRLLYITMHGHGADVALGARAYYATAAQRRTAAELDAKAAAEKRNRARRARRERRVEP